MSHKFVFQDHFCQELCADHIYTARHFSKTLILDYIFGLSIKSGNENCKLFRSSLIINIPTIIVRFPVCPYGTFGSNCTGRCHCSNNDDCSSHNGTCPNGCERGWTGISCDKCGNVSIYYSNCLIKIIGNVIFNSIRFNTNTCTRQLIKYRVGAHDE